MLLVVSSLVYTLMSFLSLLIQNIHHTSYAVVKLLEIMEQLGCEDGIDDELWKPNAKHELHPYPPVGLDNRGCATTWIRAGGVVSKEDERYVDTCCMYIYLLSCLDLALLNSPIF